MYTLHSYGIDKMGDLQVSHHYLVVIEMLLVT